MEDVSKVKLSDSADVRFVIIGKETNKYEKTQFMCNRKCLFSGFSTSDTN